MLGYMGKMQQGGDLVKMQPKKFTTKTISLTTILLLIIPLISAFNGWGGGRWGWYRGPLEYLENEWVLFGVLFLIFFAVIFYTLNKAFKNNVIAGVIALGLSVLISMAIAQRGLLDVYGGGEISSWALFLAAAVGIAFLIRFAAETFGWIGAGVTAFVVWLILRSFYPEQLLPELLTNVPAFMWIYNFLLSWLGLVLLIILAFILGSMGRKTIKEISQAMERTPIRWSTLRR